MAEVVLSLYRGLVERPTLKPMMREIAELVAERHGLTLADLLGRDRSRRCSHPRQEAMALMMAEGRFSYTQVGRFFKRDHTTVLHGKRAHEKRVARAQAAQVNAEAA